jgi:hypothetical protein
MPRSKTIEIDEIVTPEKPPGERSGHQKDPVSSSASFSKKSSSDSSASNTEASMGSDSGDPFSQFQKSLPWKARITLYLTRWFVFLRSKSWGKLVIVPIIIVTVLLAIPLGLIAVFLLIIRSLLFPRR